MKVLHVAAEVAPYSQVGGLSQVMFFLPRSLQQCGMDVHIFTPKYGEMKLPEGAKLTLDIQWLRVPKDDTDNPPMALQTIKAKDTKTSIICNVCSLTKDSGVTVHFLENREYYELRANVFGYKDDHIRFALLSKACLEWLLFIKLNRPKDAWFPDIIHCHDWHTGYLIDYAKRDSRYSELLKDVKVIFTIHNLAYQGNYDFRYNLDKYQDDGRKHLFGLLDQGLQKQNALLRGIMFADGVNTVSPTHAKEIMTPEFGEGLDTWLSKYKDKVSGIMNGLDFKEFNPETDEHIMRNFNVHSFVHARAKNKMDLQEVFGLPVNENAFLMGSVGRVAPQKGWDIVLEVLPNLLRERPQIQIVIVGRGDDHYCQQLSRLKKQFHKQLGLRLIADFTLPRKIFAGTDAMLIASSFEPGGIVALEAMRYGSVPIIRRTGGLNDVIADFNPKTMRGTGFSFTSRTPWALYGAIVEASTFFLQKNMWHAVVANALRYVSSWEHSAKKYIEWYRHVLYSL